ncbi:rhythmically expressed gene 2 protein [Microplitis demolitor]|uniref:rhythmically expressed gene 2 protein n=1 Tax=Microplitis demolitor TaxID=69319 RepID=UPI00235B6E59|nr:rhythmically expressed gene 2 protein [Microplitis demolitor]
MNVQNITKLRLITFDVTNTLLKTSVKKNYIDVSSKHGVFLENPDKLASSFKKHFLLSCSKYPNFGRSELGWENWWKNVVRSVFKDQNLQISDEKIDEIATDLIKYYGTNKCWEVFPGALDILEYLYNRRIILGVISNFDERLESILINTHLRKYFSFILTSYIYGKEKPNISIFNEALKLGEKKLGDKILPEESLHIGDNIDNDYNGAKNARWNAFLMDHKYKFEEFENTSQCQRFNSLYELKNHFKTILN